MFKLADKGIISIIIPDYVYKEICKVFEEHEIDVRLLNDFLDTFSNIQLFEEDLSIEDELIELGKSIVRDPKDIPIFIFAKKHMEDDEKTFLVTGDADLLDENVKESLFNRVFRAKELLKLFGKA